MFSFIISVDAETKIIEDTSKYEGDVYIIGSSKFDSDIIITATMASKAGAREAYIQYFINKNLNFNVDDNELTDEEIDEISVTVDYEEDPINVGEYTVTVTISLIDIVHYEEISAAKSYYECKVKINPREVTPHLEQSSFTYTGDIPTLDLYFTGMVNNEEVKGTVTPLTSAIVGDYIVTCALDTQDPVTANYVIASGKEKINVSINKATISMLSVTFVFTYSLLLLPLKLTLSLYSSKRIDIIDNLKYCLSKICKVYIF